MNMRHTAVALVVALLIFELTELAQSARADIAPVTTFWGLSLGQSEVEVEQLKGVSATHVTSGPACWGSSTSAPFTETWAYQGDGGVYYIDLRYRKIWSVVFYANKGVAPDFPVGGVGDSRSALEAKLGVPSLISDSKDQTARWVSFEKYSVAYQLRNDKVVMFGIYDPALGSIQYCD